MLRFQRLIGVLLLCAASVSAYAWARQDAKSDALPAWLVKLIAGFDAGPLPGSPGPISRFDYKGQVVYYVPPQCCDIPSTLYDAKGVVVCHPDGGFTGRGDGKCPDFFAERKNERVVWKQRTPEEILSSAQGRWAAKKPARYEFSFQATCLCPSDFVKLVTFRVEDARSTLLTAVDEKVRSSFERYATVDKLFELIRTELARRPDKFLASYDPELGYPTHLSIDRSLRVSDDELSFLVSNFKPLR